MTVVVSGKGLTKTYVTRRGRMSAISNLDLELEAGEVVVVAGPSGAGKSVLANLLAGWEEADAGTIMWDGRTDRPSWALVSVVPQALALVEELTIAENVTLWQRFHGNDSEAARAAMEEIGIAHLAERMPAEVSVGERQRTMVARALAGTPRLLIADEPTAHQDAANARRVMDALYARAERGAACIIATRHPDDLERPARLVRLPPAE